MLSANSILKYLLKYEYCPGNFCDGTHKIYDFAPKTKIFEIDIYFYCIHLQEKTDKTSNSMDVRDIFRKLTTNKYIPDFDYKNYKLSFQTVFYTCNYKHCCCPCAFDHEWLTYISDGGQLEEELYKKVEANLLAGKCPHVDDVISDYVRETAVYGMHIAAAVGTSKAVKNDLGKTHRELQSSLFRLSPYVLAVLKKNIRTSTLWINNLSKKTISSIDLCMPMIDRMLNVVYPERSETNAGVIHLKEKPLLVFCVRSGNIALLRVVLLPNLLDVESYMTQFATALGLAIRCNDVSITKELIKFLTKNHRHFSFKKFTHGLDGLESIVYRLVVLDKPDILERLSKPGFGRILLDERLCYSLIKLCAARPDDRCNTILSKVCDVRSSLLDRKENPYVRDETWNTHLRLLFHLFDEFPDIITHELEVMPGLQTDLQGVLSKFGTTLFRLPWECTTFDNLWDCIRFNSYILRKCNTRIMETTCRPVIKWILQQTKIVDNINNNNRITPFDALRRINEREKHSLDFRANFETLLYSNINLHESVVQNYLKVDENLFCKEIRETFVLPQMFITDAKEHSVFGHNSGSDYALEFTVPLLLECGYPVTRETQEAALDRNLHPDELKYIRAYIDTPRSLKLRCRDVLKKHFKGRHLHNFLEMSPIPQSIKDFILLKTILTCV